MKYQQLSDQTETLKY